MIWIGAILVFFLWRAGMDGDISRQDIYLLIIVTGGCLLVRRSYLSDGPDLTALFSPVQGWHTRPQTNSDPDTLFIMEAPKGVRRCMLGALILSLLITYSLLETRYLDPTGSDRGIGSWIFVLLLNLFCLLAAYGSHVRIEVRHSGLRRLRPLLPDVTHDFSDFERLRKPGNPKRELNAGNGVDLRFKGHRYFSASASLSGYREFLELISALDADLAKYLRKYGDRMTISQQNR